MTLQQQSHIYFIGIGGIGMSGLARFCNKQGIKVSGYDKTRTPLTDALEAEGIRICFDDSISHLSPDISLVIYTPAVPTTHAQYVHFLAEKTPIMKRAAALGLVADSGKTIAIAGTHGKTTTTCMVTYALKESGTDVSAFLGGILVGYDTNNIIGTDPHIVVEADEYDRSFLQLHPHIAVVNAIDADHLDIYGDQAAFNESFIQFLNQTIAGGLIILKEEVASALGAEVLSMLNAKYKVVTFGFAASNDWVITDHTTASSAQFSLKSDTDNVEGIAINLFGKHNIANASVAVIVALHLGVSKDDIKSALGSFVGVKRRFEKIVTTPKVYIDDYAHHPQELNAAHQAVRAAYPKSKVAAIFQPHLFTRTRDFMLEFAASLSQFDSVILLNIYPAREEAIPGITSQALAAMIDTECQVLSKEEALEWVEKADYDVLMTLGAGDIDTLIPQIKNLLQNI